MKDIVTNTHALNVWVCVAVWLAVCVCELGTDFYLPLFLTHDLIHEYERCFHVGSLSEVIPIFSLCICAFDCENEMKWTINRFPWWNQESRKKDGQPLDNHHRSNKSKRFIANGGFEYIYLAILFGSLFIRQLVTHEAILIYTSHLINIPTRKTYDMLEIGLWKE